MALNSTCKQEWHVKEGRTCLGRCVHGQQSSLEDPHKHCPQYMTGLQVDNHHVTKNGRLNVTKTPCTIGEQTDDYRQQVQLDREHSNGHQRTTH